jgi:uncharacterized cupin superfamily protein
LISRVAVLLLGFLDLITTDPLFQKWDLSMKKKRKLGCGMFHQAAGGFWIS